MDIIGTWIALSWRGENAVATSMKRYITSSWALCDRRDIDMRTHIHFRTGVPQNYISKGETGNMYK